VSLLSLATPTTRERLARELDDRGPEACVTEVINDLKQHDPEFLDMAVKCARSRGDYSRVMQGFGCSIDFCSRHPCRIAPGPS
jgi:hypothetical protein